MAWCTVSLTGCLVVFTHSSQAGGYIGKHAHTLNFVDMNSKTTHTEALFGYSYSVARPHFIRNQALGIDYTLSDCYQSFSVSFKPYLLQN